MSKNYCKLAADNMIYLKNMKVLAVSVLVALIFSSCQKNPGEGGSSQISGRLIAQKFDAFGALIAEYDLADERVYIIYGENSNVYDDNMRSSFDGSFRFDFLRKGKYRVFVYSKCPSCPGGEEAIIREVEITRNKEKIVIPTITVRK
jgi:hypothetical protein